MSIAKLSKSTIKRKIITCILTISLVLSSFSFAFAHPTTADTFADAITSGWTYDNSGLGSPYGKDMSSSWYQIFGKNTLSMLRDVRYQLTGTDYDNHNGNSINTYVNNIYSTLTNTGSGSILYGINQTNTKLSDIYNSIGVGGSGNNVLTKLSSLINAVGDISIPDLTSYVSNIDTGVTTINTDGIKLTGNALNRLNQIAGYTSWISTIRDTTNRIDAINTTISSISADTYSELSSLHDDFNNVSWLDSGTYNGIKTTLGGEFLSADTNGTEFYVSYTVPANSNVFKITVPLTLYAGSSNGANIDIDIIQSNSAYTISYDIKDYEISYSSTGAMIVYAYVPNIRYILPIQLHIKSDKVLRYISSIQPGIQSVSRDSKDMLDVVNNIFLNNIVDLFYQAKEIYFDDETLQAKKNNSSQTTAVLTSFTGNGQASATVNDYGTLSSGVSNVKGGMTTNVNASRAFGIFNNEFGYSFWSSETLQELNSSGSNTRNLSKSNDDDGYVYYNGRLEHLLNAMIGDDKK